MTAYQVAYEINANIKPGSWSIAMSDATWMTLFALINNDRREIEKLQTELAQANEKIKISDNIIASHKLYEDYEYEITKLKEANKVLRDAIEYAKQMTTKPDAITHDELIQACNHAESTIDEALANLDKIMGMSN